MYKLLSEGAEDAPDVVNNCSECLEQKEAVALTVFRMNES